MPPQLLLSRAAWQRLSWLQVLLVTPLVLPALVHVGFDPVHMGVVLIILVSVGGNTPPVGVISFEIANGAQFDLCRPCIHSESQVGVDQVGFHMWHLTCHLLRRVEPCSAWPSRQRMGPHPLPVPHSRAALRSAR